MRKERLYTHSFAARGEKSARTAKRHAVDEVGVDRTFGGCPPARKQVVTGTTKPGSNPAHKRCLSFSFLFEKNSPGKLFERSFEGVS